MTFEIEMEAAQLKRTEYLLKKSLAKRMMWIQSDRHLSAKGGNIGNAETYVQEARALRDVLRAQGSNGERRTWQHYKPLREMIVGSDVDDTTAELAGIENIDELHEAAEKVRAIRNPNVPPRTLTDYEKVPGGSA